MTKRPLIGLTTNKVPYSAEDQDVVYFLNITYVESIVQAGGVPLLLPYEFDAWDVLDGALICGGHDLMPALGGYEAEPGALAEFRAARDAAGACPAARMRCARPARARRMPRLPADQLCVRRHACAGHPCGRLCGEPPHRAFHQGRHASDCGNAGFAYRTPAERAHGCLQRPPPVRQNARARLCRHRPLPGGGHEALSMKAAASSACRHTRSAWNGRSRLNG